MASTSEPLHIIRPTNRIQGVFATSDITHGTIIMSESPLLQSSDCSFFEEYKALNTSSWVKFHKLYNSIPRESSTFSDTTAETAQEIWETNKFAITADEDAVFAEASRLNHSCNPNAKWMWNGDTGEIYIVALEDIKRGQEILISYLQFNNQETVIDRRMLLLEWGFFCQCQRCMAESGETSLEVVTYTNSMESSDI